ncbi:hypothetical protein E8E14_004055 [Neopestalotiopsis sp. 37M]|nr:hypothetical protein E8E14_004055 [Neopestalotiopsis sp. 37M]
MAAARSILLANILPLAAVQALMLPRQGFCQLDAFDFIPALANFEPALEFCSSSFPVPAATVTVTPITDGITTKTRTVTVFSNLVTPIIDPLITPVPLVKRSEGGENKEEVRRGLDFFGGRFPDDGHRPHWPDFGGPGGQGYTSNNAGGYGGGDSGSPYGDDYNNDQSGEEYDDGEGDTPDGTWYPAPEPETTSALVDPTFLTLPTLTLPTITEPLPTISLVSSLTSDLGPIETSISDVLSSLTSDISSVLPSVLPSLTSDLSSVLETLTSDLPIPTLPLPTVTPFTTREPIPIVTSILGSGGAAGASALSSLQALDADFQSAFCSCIEEEPTFTITAVPTATGLLTAVETVTVTLPRPRHGNY